MFGPEILGAEDRNVACSCAEFEHTLAADEGGMREEVLPQVEGGFPGAEAGGAGGGDEVAGF